MATKGLPLGENTYRHCLLRNFPAEREQLCKELFLVDDFVDPHSPRIEMGVDHVCAVSLNDGFHHPKLQCLFADAESNSALIVGTQVESLLKIILAEHLPIYILYNILFKKTSIMNKFRTCEYNNTNKFYKQRG